jgi:glycosyltransferase involved in cell wall biosynthesis
MRIAFLSQGDLNNPSVSSGMPHFIFRELAKRSKKIAHFSTPSLDRFLFRSQTALRRSGMSGFDPLREDIAARTYSLFLHRELKAFDPDIVFAVVASPMIARLKSVAPIVHFSDSTYASLLNYYPGCTGLSRRTIRQGNLMESRALQNATIILFPSQWATDSAINDYKIDPAKIHTVPIGANFYAVEPTSFVSSNWSDVCRLLFVGVDWERKGGDVARAVLVELLNRGVRAELHVVGCNPPAGHSHPQMVCHGFLTKTSDQAKLTELFSRAAFLIVPSRQEAYGIVFAEASAFGTPSLATRTGGIPSVVQQGVNGFLFAPEATAAEYVDKICQLWGNQTAYMAIRRSSHQRFLDTLNWTTWGDRVMEIIGQRC